MTKGFEKNSGFYASGKLAACDPSVIVAAAFERKCFSLSTLYPSITRMKTNKFLCSLTNIKLTIKITRIDKNRLKVY